MLSKHTIFTLLIFLGFSGGMFFAVPSIALAKTVYVEKDGDDDNEGTSDEPFKTLEEAAEEANEGEADEIKIGKGSFSGEVIFERGVTIQGAGKGSTTLTGTLTFKKKAELKNLSIKTKARHAVTLGKNSEATIKNVDIRDYSRTGIWINSGGAALTLEDSRIGGGGGKGIYAEAGTKLTLVGNSIVNNKQEGIDIRQNTRGTIKNNVIEGNSESGIELIVGSSDFVIAGNDIKKNGASGIAFQFYQLTTKFGTITATGNTISGNKKYGIDCNKPQKGDTPVGYWADSITLDANAFASNSLTDISVICKLVEAKTEEEEEKLEQEAVKEEQTEAQAAGSADAASQESLPQQNQLAEGLVENIAGIVQEDQYQSLVTELEQRNKIQTWLQGWDKEAVEKLRTQIENDQEAFELYQESVASLETYKNRSDLQGRVQETEQKLGHYQALLANYENKKGVLEYIHVKPLPPEIVKPLSTIAYVLIF